MVTRSVNDVNTIDQEYLVERDAAVISDGLTLFNVTGGPILLTYAMAECVTANGASATTIQLRSDGTAPIVNSTITAASGSLANVSIGTTVVAANLGSLNGSFAVNEGTAGGVGISAAHSGTFIPVGILNVSVTNGPTTGTWKWRIKYKPLSSLSSVSAA